MKNKKGFLQGALVGALVVFIIMGLVSCGIVGAGRNIVSSDSEQKLSALRQMIDENYLGEVDDSELTEGLYKGYMEALGDPYSEYYDEKETKELTESISGEFSGVGALLSQNRDTGLITITKVYENSPAMKAGLEDGDILYKVDAGFGSSGIRYPWRKRDECKTYGAKRRGSRRDYGDGCKGYCGRADDRL